MTFLRRSIEFYVGDGFVLDSVAEVHLIELQPTAQSTARNRMPNSTEKRKRQLEKRRMAIRVKVTIS